MWIVLSLVEEASRSVMSSAEETDREYDAPDALGEFSLEALDDISPEDFDSLLVSSQGIVPLSSPELQNNEDEDEIQRREQWNNHCVASLQFLFELNQQRSTTASIRHFGVHNGNRYTALKASLSYLIIFPWFRYQGEKTRFRQTLAVNESSGPTIGTIVDAINYFLQRPSPYSIEELHFLTEYYRVNGCPSQSVCFTEIQKIYLTFKGQFQQIPPPLAPVLPEPSQVVTLSQQMNQLQVQSDTHSQDIQYLRGDMQMLKNELGEMNRTLASSFSSSTSSVISTSPEMISKKRKHSGDRATYYLIREADRKTKKDWCIPGGVFGLYADGVGPLRPLGRCRIVVYSTLPDIEEPHPDPAHPDRYVRIVMVRDPLHPSAFLIFPPYS